MRGIAPIGDRSFTVGRKEIRGVERLAFLEQGFL
ncbi:hypothetical protein MT49_1502 [Mycobacterium tuberculosis 49-02]|nr:hypothetical protein MT49_1502 [Mycobacterium tuberculosis 49-02]